MNSPTTRFLLYFKDSGCLEVIFCTCLTDITWNLFPTLSLLNRRDPSTIKCQHLPFGVSHRRAPGPGGSGGLDSCVSPVTSQATAWWRCQGVGRLFFDGRLRNWVKASPKQTGRRQTGGISPVLVGCALAQTHGPGSGVSRGKSSSNGSLSTSM